MNRLTSVSRLSALAVALFLSNSARADVIYDSGIFAAGGANGLVTADSANTTTVTSSDFSIGTSATVTEVKWYGGYYIGNVAPATDSFTIRFFNFNGAVPATTPFLTYAAGNAVTRADTGKVSGTVTPVEIYSYDALIPTTFLTTGRYAFSVQDNTTDKNNYFFWSTGRSVGHSVFFGSSVLNADNTTAFMLLGTTAAIPEPSVFLMLGVGSVSVIAFKRAACAKHNGLNS